MNCLVVVCFSASINSILKWLQSHSCHHINSHNNCKDGQQLSDINQISKKEESPMPHLNIVLEVCIIFIYFRICLLNL